jgi:hypothetical protein
MPAWAVCTRAATTPSDVYVNLDNVLTLERFDQQTLLTFVDREYRVAVVEDPETILSRARHRPPV